MAEKHPGGRPRKFDTVDEMKHDWGDGNLLSPLEALSEIGSLPSMFFTSEKEYRQWFVACALPVLVPFLADGAELDSVRTDARVLGTRLRIDVIAQTTGVFVLGFELKSSNPRYPQTHISEVTKGFGQTMLYQDCMRECYGNRARVFLVSDVIPERVGALTMRHNYIVNLIEANPESITCMAAEEISCGID